MPHNDYVFPQGSPQGITVPNPKRLSLLDDLSSKFINGDDGGTWAPSAPLYWYSTSTVDLTTASSLLSGGLTTKKFASGAPAQVVLGNNDIPSFTANRTRTLIVPCAPAIAKQSMNPEFDYDPVFGAVRSMKGAARILVPLPQLRMHNGATLTGATLTWRVGLKHALLPSPRPSLQIWRISVSGLTIQSLNPTPAAPSPANPDAYYANGSAQSLAYAPTQNNIIDTVNYHYVADWNDEPYIGTVPPQNLLHFLTLTLGAIGGMGFE